MSEGGDVTAAAAAEGSAPRQVQGSARGPGLGAPALKPGLGFWVLGSGLRVKGLGFRV